MICALYALDVPDEVFARIEARLDAMRGAGYRYSVMGLLLCRLDWPVERERHMFCSQFVGRLMEECGAEAALADAAGGFCFPAGNAADLLRGTARCGGSRLR